MLLLLLRALPPSGDASRGGEGINSGPALQPLPFATNPSPHTEDPFKSVLPSPDQPTHVLQQTCLKGVCVASSAQLASLKMQAEHMYLGKPGLQVSS